MARNEKSSPKVAKIASKALKSGKATSKEIKSLAGSVLTQRPDKRKNSKSDISKKFISPGIKEYTFYPFEMISLIRLLRVYRKAINMVNKDLIFDKQSIVSGIKATYSDYKTETVYSQTMFSDNETMTVYIKEMDSDIETLTDYVKAINRAVKTLSADIREILIDTETLS